MEMTEVTAALRTLVAQMGLDGARGVPVADRESHGFPGRGDADRASGRRDAAGSEAAEGTERRIAGGRLREP